jgi:hypothetical protein
MTVRGGGIPRRPLALTPNGRMGPPLRSFAADAHDCIMVRVLGPTGYKVVARLNRAPKAGSPLIVIATALSVPSCSKPSRYGLARAKHAARLVRRPILTASARIDLSDARVGMKKRTLRSNQETDEGKRCAALANSLTKKAPYKGPWCRFRREARARERRRHWSCWMASAACLPRWAYALWGSGR